ncbi:MAG: hypothetical protein J0H15_01820 [Xanthomonadales bacterium]|nr:hypothetical protein [Xanthomonadales bacterium]
MTRKASWGRWGRDITDLTPGGLDLFTAAKLAGTAGLFRAQAKGKLPTAPLLSRWNGSAWDKDAWKVPIKDAARAAELPAETSAYTLRHSVITDLVTDGLDLFTVAKLAGTSVAMIEKHYGHLRQERARRAGRAGAVTCRLYSNTIHSHP